MTSRTYIHLQSHPRGLRLFNCVSSEMPRDVQQRQYIQLSIRIFSGWQHRGWFPIKLTIPKGQVAKMTTGRKHGPPNSCPAIAYFFEVLGVVLWATVSEVCENCSVALTTWASTVSTARWVALVSCS